MAKRKASKPRAKKRVAARSGNNLLGVKYNSLTFLLFLAFVLLVSWLLVYKFM